MKPRSQPTVAHIPDVFDEDAEAAKKTAPVSVEVEERITVVEPPGEDLPAPRPPRVVTEVMTEETESVAGEASGEDAKPSFTVRQNGMTVEQKLPSFFVEGEDQALTKEDETPPAVDTTVSMPQTPEEKMLETVVPQAFVGEVSQVAREVKQEKKGTLVTFFIILGMILVAVGAVGLYILSVKKNTQVVTPAPTSQPTPVAQATPAATPTVIVTTATGSAVPTTSSPTTKLKVNVLNGTKVKGLAAKEAALLKKAGYVLGTVGNGDPGKAGTITVPTGSSSVAEGIKSILSNFTFTVSEDPKAKDITVTLGDPQ